MIIVEEKQHGIKVGDTLKFKPLPEIMKMINDEWKMDDETSIPKDMIDIMVASKTLTVEKYPVLHFDDRFLNNHRSWPIAFFEIPQEKVVRMCDMEPGQTGVVVGTGYCVYKLRNKQTLIISSRDGNYYASTDCSEKVRLCDLKLTEV